MDSYSPADVRALRWNSEASQHSRFRSLLRLGDFNGTSLLDIGCGTGDFLGFLLSQNIKPMIFHGIDLMPEFIQVANRRYCNKAIRFYQKDFFETDFHGSFDYIICNGALNVREKNNMLLLEKAISKSLKHCKKALGFTLLKHADGYLGDERIFHYQKDKVYEVAKKYSNNVEFFSDYADNDFTLIIRKDSAK